MSTELFIKASEIAEIMGKSKSYGYKVVRTLNKELSDKGYMIVKMKKIKLGLLSVITKIGKE